MRLTSDGEVFLRHAKRIVTDHMLMIDDLVGERSYAPGGEGLVGVVHCKVIVLIHAPAVMRQQAQGLQR